MRLAFSRAGLWFFGTLIVVFFLLYEQLGEYTTAEVVSAACGIAFVVSGTVFFYTWHEHEKKKCE